MSKWLYVLAVAVIGILPPAVSAQAQSPAVPPPEQAIEGIDASRVVVIGAGLLIGALAMEVLVAGDVAILAGAVVGGVMADWWYRTKDYDTIVPKARYRAAALPAPSTSRLAMVPRQ